MNNLTLRGKTVLCFVVMIICTTACEKELPRPHASGDEAINSYSELFDRFWNQMNSNYQFWDQDTTDWDAVYTRYAPLFAKLDINDDNDQRKSVQYFHEMLANCYDGHLGVSFYAPAVADSGVYPRLDENVAGRNPNFLPGELQRTPDYYSFTYYDIDKGNYLDSGIISDTYNGINVLSGFISNNIFYLGFDAENLNIGLLDPNDNVFRSAFHSFQQALQKPDLKAIIVDMRGSTGGDSYDGTVLASQMIDKPLFRGSVRHKSGTGRLDYTPWVPTYITPATGAKAIKVPLFILTDVITYSAAEYVTSALHSIPGSITIGTATRGGMTGNGVIDNMQGDGDMYFDRFYPHDFMEIGMSTAAYRFIDGKTYPFGFPPDVEVPFDTTAILASKDPQLEKALSLIH